MESPRVWRVFEFEKTFTLTSFRLLGAFELHNIHTILVLASSLVQVPCGPTRVAHARTFGERDVIWWTRSERVGGEVDNNKGKFCRDDVKDDDDFGEGKKKWEVAQHAMESVVEKVGSFNRDKVGVDNGSISA